MKLNNTNYHANKWAIDEIDNAPFENILLGVDGVIEWKIESIWIIEFGTHTDYETKLYSVLIPSNMVNESSYKNPIDVTGQIL